MRMVSRLNEMARVPSEPTEVSQPEERPMIMAMVIVFISFVFILFMASEASLAGSESMAIVIVAAIIVLFTFIDPEFGIYCLVAGMLLSPEIKLFSLPSRDVIVRIDDMMIVLVGFTWFSRVAVKGKGNVFGSTPLNRPIFWLCFLSVISTTQGILLGSVGHPLTAFFFILKFFEFFLLYLLVANSISREAQVRRIMIIYFITVLSVAFWATWTTIVTRQYGRATTPFETAEEPGTLGGYLLFSFALAVGLLNYATGIIRRLIYFGVLVAILPPFLYTLSRGSYMAFFPMFLSVLLLSKKKTVPIILLIVLAIASPWLPGVTIERVEYTFQNRIENLWSPDPNAQVELDPSSAARLERYEGVINQWMYHPLIGQGWTGVGFVDSQIVRTLGEMGLLGIFALLWLFRNIFQASLQLYRKLPDGFAKGLTLGLLAGTVGLLFHGTTANTFTVVRIAGPFWVVVGMVMSLYQQQRKREEETVAA